MAIWVGLLDEGVLGLSKGGRLLVVHVGWLMEDV